MSSIVGYWPLLQLPGIFDMNYDLIGSSNQEQSCHLDVILIVVNQDVCCYYMRLFYKMIYMKLYEMKKKYIQFRNWNSSIFLQNNFIFRKKSVLAMKYEQKFYSFQFSQTILFLIVKILSTYSALFNFSIMMGFQFCILLLAITRIDVQRINLRSNQLLHFVRKTKHILSSS